MKIKFLDDDDELIQTTTDDEPILRLTLGHSPLTLPVSRLGPITGEGTIDSPRTNIPGLAEAQARYAEFQRQQRQQALEQAQPQDAETLSSGLAPITGEGTIDSPRTNIPGLAEAQRQQSALWRSITHQAQPQDELALTTTQPQGHLSGLLRYLALIGLGTADFGGKILMGWPAQIAASFGQIQENIAGKTNEMFSRIAAKQGIPSKELDGVNPSESYGTMIAKDLGDIYAPYSNNMREAYTWVAGDNPSWVDRGFHGAGTSLGFMLAGWGLGTAIRAGALLSPTVVQAGRALSPGVAYAIGGGLSGLLEAGAESGTFLLDKYAEDPTRWSDALRASQHSFSANAPTDMLIGAVENMFNPVTAGVSRSPKKLLRSFLTEILTENIQEAKQTAIEQAAELTYKSGDLSLSNFLSNLENEGKKIPHYLYEQGAEVTLSTVISSAISALLGLPLGHGRNRDTQTSPTQTHTIEEMTTERDRLQEEIDTLYQNADIDPTTLADIQTLQERLDNLNMNIAASEAEGVSMFPEEQEILNPQPQTDTHGAVPAPQTPTEQLVSSGPSDGIQETQSIPTAEQFNTGIPPAGSTQDSRAIPNAEEQQAQSEGQQKISIEHDGRTHEFTVNVGEYSSKNAKQKSIFGRYIEIRDSKGNVVARYSPSTGRFEGSLTSPYNRKTLLEKIANALFSNEAIFKDNGFINENGNLIEGSDKGKSFYLQRRALAEQARMAAKKRQGKIRRGIEKLRAALSKGFDTVSDMFTPIEELGLRYQIKSKLLKLNHPEFGEKVSDYYSRIIARMASRLASYAGVSPKEYLASRGFKIVYDDNNASVYLHNEDGSVQIDNANIQYAFNPEYDEQGNIIHEATNIIKMFNTANPSTIIHETGHFYLNSLRDLFRTGRLQGQARKDWGTLVSWLGLEGMDLTKTKEQMTPEERDRLKNAHEKFAVSFEKYIMQSKAPKMNLKRAYEAFRHWLWDVYQDVTVIDLGDGYIADADMIPFIGADGKEHYFTLDPEVPYVMGRMFTDINKKGATFRHISDHSANDAGTESYSQRTKRTKDNSELTNTERALRSIPKKIRRSNDSFLTPERYEQLALHATGRTILGNRFDIKDIGSGTGFQLYGWGIYFSDDIEDVTQYRKVGTKTKTKGNLYTANIPENEMLLNWNANISDQSDIVKKGLQRAIVRAKKLGASEETLSKLKSAKVGHDFYHALEFFVIPEIFDNLIGENNKKYRNDMAASLLLNQAGIPGLYHTNLYLDYSSYEMKKKASRNFVIWNTDMIKLLDISQDSSEEAKTYFANMKRANTSIMEDRHKTRAIIDNARKISDMVEKELGLGKDKKQSTPKRMHQTKHIKSAPENYSQIAIKADTFTLTPEAQRQMEEVKRQYEGTAQWMKAPNGKDTKLTEQQWLVVRTPNFIRWFGDWINNPQSASKVVDENGEPRVFYRGVFKNTDTLSPVLKSHNPTRIGVFYTSSLEAANSYTLKDSEYGVKRPIHKKKIYEVFLNIRNPYVVKGNGALWSRLEPTYAVIRRGGNKFKNVIAKDFKSMQEALDFMRAQKLDERQFRAVEWGTKTTDQIVSAVFKGDKGFADNGQPYDGVIFEKIEDVMAAVFTDENYIADVPVVFSPNQAKSATRNNGNFDPADENHYHQIAKKVDDFALTPEAQRQMDEVRRQYEGTAQWLKAPNGKDTKLTEQQWLAVRTPNFIRWFGDWINDPENASKILDENGEPLVLYHGSWADNSFSIFKMRDAGAWFTPLRQDAEPYTKLARNKKSRRIYPVFLNVRNPYIFDAKGRNWDNLEDIYIEDKEGEPIRVDENGKPFTSNQQAQNFIANALPFEDGFYHGRYNVHSASTADIAKAVYNGALGDGNYDGLIIKDVTDPNPHMDDYIVYLPENIKSATNNNGEYDTADPDHYHQISKLKNIKNGIQSALNTPTVSLEEIVIRADEAGLTPEARRQVAAVRRKYQGTKYWMKAPNGKRTKLTELQWLLARTPNFKRWFGDWENNPENASKALDENGEPLVLYHGGEIDTISVFSTPDGVGAWFTPSLSAARHYVGKKGVYYDENSPEYHNNIYPVFLNIRNPYTYDAKGHYWTSIGEVYILDDKEGERIYTDRKGNPFTDYSQAQSFINDVLAKQEGYNKYRYIIRSTYPQTTDDLVEGVWTGRIGEGKHDGVVIKNVEDPELMDDYVIYAPVDIKSATKNNGEFSPADADHYHQIIGIPAARRLDENERVTTRMDSLKLAQKLEKELPPAWRFIRNNNTDYSGIFVDDYSAERYIWLNTGWFRGADGQWRYELPYGTIEQGAWDKIIHSGKRENIRLEDFFDAPELFGAYPDLRGLRVSFKQLPRGVAGRYTEHGTIDLDIQLLNDIAQARRFLIHEIQHAIQHFEGFALGGNEDIGYYFKDRNLAARGGFNKFAFIGKNAERKAQIIFDNLIHKQQEKFTSLLDTIRAMEKSTPRHEQWEATMKLIEDNISPKYREKFLSWFSLVQQAEGYKAMAKNSIFMMTGDEAYQYMSGEVEARNAAKRSDMPEEKRRTTSPKDTQIIKDEQQLIFDRRDIDYSKVENYHQIIGVKGARALDKAEGNTNRMDNLDIAREMRNAGKDTKTIRLATGWELAPDNKWRYEIDDGKLLRDNIAKAYKKNKKSHPFSMTLGEVYDNPELFRAYPQLAKTTVVFSEEIRANGIYSHKHKSDGLPRITLRGGRSLEKIRGTLIHEIQHAVQHIEGFATGGGPKDMIIQGEYPEKYAFKRVKAIINNIKDANLRKMALVYMRRDTLLAQQILSSLPEKKQEYGKKIFAMIDRARFGQLRLNPYYFYGGEVEAKNASSRKDYSPQRRRNITLAETQGTNEWLIDRDGKPVNYSVVSSSEIYHQIIGVKGARALDKAEGNTVRMDNLMLAEIMKDNGIDAKTIRLQTGWEIAPDGKWRYEVQDTNVNLVKRIKALGILSPKKAQTLRKRANAIWDKKCALNDKIPERLTSKYTEAQRAMYRKMRQRRDELLDEYFALIEEIKDKSKLTLRDLWGDDNEVLKAYPQLASIKIEFRDLQGKMGGYWDGVTIVIEQEAWGDNVHLNNTLIHEVQHAIQDIERFAPGTAPKIYTPFFSKVYDPLLDKLKDLRHNLDRLDVISGVNKVRNALIDEVMSGKKALDEAEKAFFEARQNSLYAKEYKETQDSIDKINEKLAKLDKKYDHILHGAHNSDEAYMLTGGEIEARNTEERRLFTHKQRRNTLLSDTQDRNTWIIDPERAMQDLTAPANFVPTDFSQSEYKIRTSDDSFISDEDVERYNQPSFQGGPNIILGNEIDFSKIGTGTDILLFGWGMSSSKLLNVADNYRNMILDKHSPKRRGKLHAFTADGQEINLGNIRQRAALRHGEQDQAMLDVLGDLKNALPTGQSASSEKFAYVKQQLLKYYIKTNKSSKAEALRSIESAYRDELFVGNIYKFDVAEDDMLLHWEAPLSQQPQRVKRAIKAIREYLAKRGVELYDSMYEGDDYSTGKYFYERLAEEMKKVFSRDPRYSHLSDRELYLQGQKAASLMLNRFGVPGNLNSVYNFCIWNKDFMKLIGITPDSDPEAIEYFNTTKKKKVLEALIERNRRAEPAFRALMSELQQELGGKLITRKQMKTPERIQTKADRVFMGDVSVVRDIWAGTLVFNTEDELLEAFEKLCRRNDIFDKVNRWGRPNFLTGYRDIITHLRLQDGTVIELQLQLKDVQDVKDSIGHSIYEFITNNENSKELHPYILQAGDISKKLYSAAADGSYRKLSQSDKDTLHKLGEVLAKAKNTKDAEQAITALRNFMNKVLP